MTAVRLPAAIWRGRAARHAERLHPFADDRRGRTAAHAPHPVRDFLFQYYSFRPAQLLRWSPGAETVEARGVLGAAAGKPSRRVRG